MPIDYDKLLALKVPDVAHDYTEKDAILYALGVGLGHDPMNEAELAFVYEKNLKVLPTFACVLGYTPFWLRDLDTGIDWVKAVHGEQGVVIHRPIAPRGEVVGITRILDVVDKGPGKGALIYSERRIVDRASGEAIATLTQTTFCRGDGGFGGPQRPSPAPHALPERAPDLVCDLAHAAGGGADLPAQRRHEPAACRAGPCAGGRLPAPDPARARDLRRRRPCASQGDMRL